MQKAIVYCRVSRIGNETSNSLDSQEFALKKFLDDRKIGIYTVLKNIGSAFNKPQTDLKNILKSCKNKLLVIFEPSRLSRNLKNFKEIYKICEKNNHDIAIVIINTILNIKLKCNYKILFDLIKKAEQESIDMGKRISRTIQYKKSRELAWGKKRDVNNNIVDNDYEIKISKLIWLLRTKDSCITEIKNLIAEVGTIEDVEPFEIVEYTKDKEEYTVIDDKLPYVMSVKNIEETFKLYGIRKRKARWTSKDIYQFIYNNEKFKFCESEICNDFINLNVLTEQTTETVSTENFIEEKNNTIAWIAIYYDPKLGLPSDVVIPPGLILPNVPSLLYLPKI